MGFNDIMSAVGNMNENELRTLNSVVVSALRSKQNLKQQLAKAQFNVGDEVQFASKRGFVTGKITKINPKTIVVESGFTTWRVSPSLLSHKGQQHV